MSKRGPSPTQIVRFYHGCVGGWPSCSRNILKPWYMRSDLSSRSESWQALWQQCYTDACQISGRCDQFNNRFRGFTTPRDLAHEYHCLVNRYPLENTWWRHQMQIFFALLARCAKNSPVTGEFPSQRPVTFSSEAFFDLRLNKRLSKQSRRWWFETQSPS